MNADYMIGFGCGIILCAILAKVGVFSSTYLIAGVISVIAGIVLLWIQSRQT